MSTTIAPPLDVDDVAEILATYLCQVDDTPIDVSDMTHPIYAPSGGAVAAIRLYLLNVKLQLQRAIKGEDGWRRPIDIAELEGAITDEHTVA